MQDYDRLKKDRLDIIYGTKKPDGMPRGRVAKKRVPKEYTEKVNFLGGLSTKELERELKKRRKESNREND